MKISLFVKKRSLTSKYAIRRIDENYEKLSRGNQVETMRKNEDFNRISKRTNTD